MHMSKVVRSVAAALAVSFVAATPFIATTADAQDRRYSREHERERARFQTQHWRWDNRFNHNHYYPAVGYAVPVLPSGHISINHRGSRFFFHSGVWFGLVGGRYLVVRPPLGLIAPSLPTGYTTLWASGVPYYYANEVYYTATPDGYAVATPPDDTDWQTQGPPPVAPQLQQQQSQMQQQPPQIGMAPGAGQAGQPPVGVWYYCDSARAYYPYVAGCAEGWRTVPSAPPPPR